MKRIFNILGLASAVFALASCAYDDIDEHDNVSEYKGIVGDYVYIVGGTEPLYNQVTKTVSHTPDGDFGTIERDFEVALTKAQATDVTLSIGLDNDAVAASYSVFPDGVLNVESVTIPAGELSATVSVSVNAADIVKFTESSYMAVLRIEDVTGDVAISVNSNAAYLKVTTTTIDLSSNIISTSKSVTSFNVIVYDNGDIAGDNISAELNIRGTESAYSDFEISFEVDNSLVSAYNQSHGTEYQKIPDGIHSLTTAKMLTGATSATATFTIPNDKRSLLTDERGYLVPIVLKDASPCTASSNNVDYVIITITKKAAPLTNFYTLSLSDYNLYSNFIFSDDLAKEMSTYTYEVKFYANSFSDISRLCQWSGKNEEKSCMLRFGEAGYDANVLQLVNPAGNFVSTTKFSTGKWYLLSIVYDGSTMKMYVDGVEEGNSATGNAVTTFQRTELGMSWAGYPSKQKFDGRICEMRVWSRALSVSEMKSGICGVDASSEGLVAYWKFNEGSGHIFHDSTGNGYDMDWSNTYRCLTESSDVEKQDYSAYAEAAWVNDENNVCE